MSSWSRRHGRRSMVALAAATAALGASALLTAPAPAVAGSHRMTPAVGVHPHGHRLGHPSPSGSTPFGCQLEVPACYGPDQIRAAYRIQPLLDRGITGEGRRIVIIDAFAPPSVAADLHTFDAIFGLDDPALTIIAPQGAVWDPNDPNQVGWSAEIALDTQWAHAVAPDAEIVLVEARSNDDADILAATKYAVDHSLGDVISQSFGEDESCMVPRVRRAQERLFARATAKRITLIASSGDSGSAQPTCDGTSFSKAASTPASDPRVLGIGGTDLTADGVSGAYGSETVWNESAEFEAAGGGGFSVLYGRPFYQNGTVHRARRGVPDVAYNAAINHGVIAFWGQDGAGGHFYAFGGTSAGAPQWSGLTVLGTQLAGHRLGLLNPTLYRAAHSRAAGRIFHDITVGDNTFSGTDVDGNPVVVPGFSARPGWDAATGLGSPIATGVVPLIAFH